MTQQNGDVMTDTIKMMPCPFCGNADIRFTEHAGYGREEHQGETVWSMCCYSCGAKVPNRYKEHGKQLMIDQWNKRAEAPQPQAGDVSERDKALEEAAITAIKIWKNAPNTKESGFVQNAIGQGCIASAKAIRALADKEG